MTRTLKRKTTGVRRQAKAQGNRARVNRARRQGSSLIGSVLALLPFTDDQIHKAFTVIILAAAAAFALFIAQISGATAFIGERFAHASANAGYEVRNVEVRGVERMDIQRVYERALGQRDLAMPHVDLVALRESLLELSWVKDARVSRQLPDALVIDIVEREPHAVLAKADRLMLIDPTGAELEPVSRAGAKDYMLIEGPGAQGQVEALTALLEAAPALRQHVRTAEWVGNRRWNLTFATDQRLALPEGEERAAAALMSFARADGVHRLIGGKAVAFDMRNPPRMSMRVPGLKDAQAVDLSERKET